MNDASSAADFGFGVELTSAVQTPVMRDSLKPPTTPPPTGGLSLQVRHLHSAAITVAARAACLKAREHRVLVWGALVDERTSCNVIAMNCRHHIHQT